MIKDFSYNDAPSSNWGELLTSERPAPSHDEGKKKQHINSAGKIRKLNSKQEFHLKIIS